jgi:prolyl-tRNA editing enzyme YbaK/EbsC (Cys-tRNA(Pro) deacylase)
MSSLDPLVASPFSNSRSLPYETLAALAKGLPLPALNGAIGGAAARPTVAVASSPKKEKAPKEKKEKAPAAPKAAAAAAPAAPPKAAASVSGVRAGVVPPNEPAPLDAAVISACQVAQEPVSSTQARLQVALDRLGMGSGKFWRVRSDYYDQELEWRRDVLGASSVNQLCKSMIMENTKLSAEEAAAAGRIKYVCVVLQYACGKLNKEKLHDAVRKMDGKNAVGKKQYSLRMVAQDVSDSLSGFEHNAVTPIGMATPVPVLLSDKLKTLPDAQMWMGGGEVDLKLRLDVKEFAEKFAPAGWPVQFVDVLEE